MATWSETDYNYVLFGECNCGLQVKANIAVISLPFFGYPRFDEEGTDTLTRYLRIDRTLVSVTPSYSFDENWYNVYVGWWIESKWTGLETKSHPWFNEPWNWVSSVKYNKTQTTRDIIFPQTVYDEFGFPYIVTVVLRETATIPWTAYDRENLLRDDIENSVPWDNPLIFDLEHWINAYFYYEEDGVLALNPFVSPNPVVAAGGCGSGFSVSTQAIGPGYSGWGSAMGMRRKFDTYYRHRLGGSPPFFGCGTAPGSPFSPNLLAPALTIITPPTNDEVLAAGATPSQYAHSSMLVCE